MFAFESGHIAPTSCFVVRAASYQHPTHRSLSYHAHVESMDSYFEHHLAPELRHSSSIEGSQRRTGDVAFGSMRSTGAAEACHKRASEASRRHLGSAREMWRSLESGWYCYQKSPWSALLSGWERPSRPCCRSHVSTLKNRYAPGGFVLPRKRLIELHVRGLQATQVISPR